MSQKLFLPDKAKLVMGLLASNPDLLNECKKVFYENFGPIDLESALKLFDVTSYYRQEMGPEIWRQFVSFEVRVPCETLAGIKVKTNALEEAWAKQGKRQVNLDPGYVTLDKLVVASTKPASYRIYLGEGIYAQPMLVFEKGSFRAWPWTYADYQWPETILFFNHVREHMKLVATNHLY